MNTIPTHKLSEKFQGEIAFLRYVSENEQVPAVNYAHRDDYYMFLFIEKGKSKLLIDFEEHEVAENTVHCILPGQIHLPVGRINASGWCLAVDRMLVKDEYKEIFERRSILENEVKLSEDEFNELTNCVLAIHRRLNAGKQYIQESIIHDLLSYYVGMIAEFYQKGFTIPINDRSAAITFQFKTLLSANYQSLKRPSQYAGKINISSIYLNEVVKKTTGLTVSECIQNEIAIQAKRLLFYTNKSVKEIASELGYGDYAYFTRLFTKLSKLSPTQFRKKYLK